MTNDNWTHYALSTYEEGRCCEIGFERQKPYLGDPSHNRNYSEGDRWELFQHIQCAEAELAAARILGFSEFYPHFNKWKTENDIPGFEVRYYRDKNDGREPVMRFSSKVDSRSEITPYILMVEGPEKRTRRSPSNAYMGDPYVAVGWMYDVDAVSDQFRTMYEGKFEVPMSKLRSMDELLPIRNSNLGIN
jgi:hypothetical protein